MIILKNGVVFVLENDFVCLSPKWGHPKTWILDTLHFIQVDLVIMKSQVQTQLN